MPSDTTFRGFSTTDASAMILAKSSSKMDVSRTYSAVEGCDSCCGPCRVSCRGTRRGTRRVSRSEGASARGSPTGLE